MINKKPNKPFWQIKKLNQMTVHEWESLCDGCGQCCLHKIEDIDNGEIAFTNVACKLLDIKSCRCSDYNKRQDKVPDCVALTPDTAANLPWLPESCAYKRLANGLELENWHPLVSGNINSIHEAGISVRKNAVSEEEAGDLEEYVTSWLNAGNNPFVKD